VLVAILVVSALLLLFIRVRASINNGKASVPAPKPSSLVVESKGGNKESHVTTESEEKKSTTIPETSLPPSTTQPIKIFFDFNRSNINKNVYCIFDKIDGIVSRAGQKNLRVMIEGNADSIGSPSYNVTLSRMRAVRVADSLSRRLASNETREGRAENRRTEVHIFY